MTHTALDAYRALSNEGRAAGVSSLSSRLRCSWKAGTTSSCLLFRMPAQLKEPSLALHLHDGPSQARATLSRHICHSSHLDSRLTRLHSDVCASCLGEPAALSHS